MKSALKICLAVVLLLLQSAYAQEVAVLLPVTGPLTPFERSTLTQEVAAEMSAGFDLKYGAEVDRFVKQVFQDESKKKDCDEANCYRRIAAKYHAEKIAALRVVQAEKGDYLVAAHLYDVASGEMTASEKMECAQCSFEKLKAVCKALSRRIAGIK